MTLYADSLVQIGDDALCFKHYYFPLGGAKCVRFADIRTVTTEKPSVLSGQFRLWGSGDFHTWFPLDWHRPTRPMLFFVQLRGSTRRIGFTVEDAKQVQQVLRANHLLTPAATESTRPAR